MTKLGTRALTRRIIQGSNINCPGCDEIVLYRPWKGTEYQILCNVYWRGRWHRVEHWHPDYYLDAGQPHGEPQP